jgi:hypothetical protein
MQPAPTNTSGSATAAAGASRPNPVWLVRSRQMASDLRYWLILTGYNRADRSLSQKIYMVYAAIFFSLWGMAMLSFLASTARQVLNALGVSSILSAASGLLSLLLLGWWLYQLYRAGRSSPLAFSEDDAYLICQTPVNRRSLAFAWLIGPWAVWSGLLGAVAVVLAFAVTDAALAAPTSTSGCCASTTTAADVPLYLLAGWRSLAVVALLVGGMLALAWAFGCLRLHGNRERNRLYLIPLALGLILLTGLLSAGGSLFNGLGRAPWNVVLAPLTFPAAGSFDAGLWGGGLLAGLAWSAAGAAGLALASGRLNLSRAGQETTRQVARQNAVLSGAAGVAEQMDVQARLGIGHTPARFRSGAGWGSLVWKNLVRTERRGAWNFLSSWLLIFLVGVGAALAPDWGGRGWALLVWASLVCRQSSFYLQNDLSLWTLFRPLPFEARSLLLADLALPVALATLLAWLSILGGAVSGAPGLTPWAALVAPGVALALGAAAAVDILRSAASQRLLAGQAGAPGGVSLALAAALLALIILAAGWLSGSGMPLPLACFTALLVSLLAAWGLIDIAQHQLRGIK